jgi:hypothetical protein
MSEQDDFLWELNTQECAILSLILTKAMRDCLSAEIKNPRTGKLATSAEMRNRHDSVRDFRAIRADLMQGFDAITILDRLSRIKELKIIVGMT